MMGGSLLSWLQPWVTGWHHQLDWTSAALQCLLSYSLTSHWLWTQPNLLTFDPNTEPACPCTSAGSTGAGSGGDFCIKWKAKAAEKWFFKRVKYPWNKHKLQLHLWSFPKTVQQMDGEWKENDFTQTWLIMLDMKILCFPLSDVSDSDCSKNTEHTARSCRSC